MTTSRASEKVLRKLTIYSSEAGPSKHARGLRSFLHALFPTVKVVVECSVLSGVPPKELDKIAGLLASARMKDPSKEKQDFEPMYGEIDYERRALLGDAKIGGIVYDGRRLLDIFSKAVPDDGTLETGSIVLTDRLVSTYSRDDMRHHLRTIVCGFPSIISLPGIVEAPAKPREYYLMRQRIEMEGGSELELARLKTAFRGRFVDYGDPSVSEVVKGLGLQAVMYHLTLDPFCDKRRCRLFNAHWQEDLIRSQAGSPGLCAAHAKLVKRLGEKPVLAW
jgi:hypothetical protein